MRPFTNPADAFPVDTLGDALGIGLELKELFGGDDLCALWLGRADGSLVDFVVLTEERGGDDDRLTWYAEASAHADADVCRAVVWRTVDDIADVPGLALAFFDRRDRLESAGVTLVDEIAVADDEFRSLAVATLCDEAGWDDVTLLLDALGGDG